MLCRLRMFKNLVHSQDVLTHRMVVCTAQLCHPPPHHHKKEGASLSLLSITIGKKGDWDVNTPARGAVCPKVSRKQNISFDLIFPEAKNLRASGSSKMSTPWPPVKVDLQCVHSVSQVLTTALKFEFKARREKTVTKNLSCRVNTTSRQEIKQHWKFLWFYF